MRAVGGQEHDVRAVLAQQAHQVDQAQRAGIVVGLRRQRVDDQHLRAGARAASAGDGSVPGAGCAASALAPTARAKRSRLRTW